MLAIVDTGLLYAAVDKDDCEHKKAVAAMQTKGMRLIFPTLVIAETIALIGMRMGVQVEAKFLATLDQCEIEAPHREDWGRMAALVGECEGGLLSAADASIVALAERIGAEVVITLDRERFSGVTVKHCEGLRVIPD